MTYTKHGHPIEGSPVTPEPEYRVRCGGPDMCHDCREDVGAFMAQEKERERTKDRLDSGINAVDPTHRAKEAVQIYWNGGHVKYNQAPVELDDLYIVSFCYILGGWKAMVSSDAWTDTSYFEVTYNVEKGERYVDHYRKVNNKRYPDDADHKLAEARKRLSR